MIYIGEKRKRSGGAARIGVLVRKEKKEREERRKGGILKKSAERRAEREGDWKQDCPGTFLVTFGVLIHTRFLHLVISEYSIYYWLVWTERATNCCVEIRSLSV